MRTIQFRGFRKDGGGWIYGDLIHNGYDGGKNFEVGIKPDRDYPEEVYPESVGQCLNKQGLNGKTVYENDILTHRLIKDALYTVEWSEEKSFFRLVLHIHGERFESYTYSPSFTVLHDYIIIGNTFEHKHLLETK